MKNISSEEITNNIMQLLAADFSQEQINTIKMCIYMELPKYTISKPETELSPELDNNVELLKLFAIDMKMRGCTDASIKAYILEAKKFETFTNKNLIQITPEDMRRYFGNGKIILKWKDNTYNTKLRILRKLFDFLVENDYMDNNPCRKIKETKVAHVMGTIIDAQQREMIRCECSCERDLAIVDMLYSSGIRVSELMGLNKSDINLGDMSGKVYGKGRKERIIYFSGQAKVHIQNYLESRTDENEALFVTSDKPHNRLTAAGIQYVLKKLVKTNPKLNGIRLSPHVLRRSIGTDMINHGAPLELVADKLGHAKIDVTRDCYASYSQESIRYGNNKYAVG